MARPTKIRKRNHGGSNRTRMDDLDDHMLTQILVRLPNCATVLSCGLLVNKRWFSLISDPTFSVQFANHKKKTTTLFKASGGSDHEDNEPPWNFVPTRQYRRNPLIKECAFGSHRKLSLEYLPLEIVSVKATFKDLVLYLYVCNDFHHVYYITNPLTMQWVALPPCPRAKDLITNTVLICQPPYNHSTQDYKFRVVVVYNTPIMDFSFDIFNLVVYCSEIGEWKEINLRVPKEARPHRLEYAAPETVVCNGIIYLNYYGLCLVALDPFDVNASSDTTLEARVMPPLPDFGYLLESSGHLLVVHASQYDGILSYRKYGTERDIKFEMVVWKLDLNQARLKWESAFQGLCKGTGNSIEFNRTRLERSTCKMSIGVHPYNDKLIYIYLYSIDQLILCDTRTRCITPSKLLPKYFMSRFHRVEHQWWPTTVSALVEQNLPPLPLKSSDDSC